MSGDNDSEKVSVNIPGTIGDEPVFETVERIPVKGRVNCSPATCGIKSANEKTGYCRSFALLYGTPPVEKSEPGGSGAVFCAFFMSPSSGG